MSFPQEGVVKYQAEHEQAALASCLEGCGLSLDPERLEALNAIRTRLHDLGLIGITPEGIGYGNLSMRLSDACFLISGTSTGAQRILSLDHYSLVTAASPAANRVRSCGMTQASSEAMSHAVIYMTLPAVQIVIHGHHPRHYSRLLQQHWPHTPAEAAYGTPELSQAIEHLIRKRYEEEQAVSGLFVTAGHQDGLFVYGTDFANSLRMLEHLVEEGSLQCTANLD